ncbi:dipeptide ABC transporter ATP-binding protein [Falsigemmobacter faecalis]|uniref:ABC transporter ATP-binding protein n=1 Tax=Falsigemmobacter faecalis TaxID=2488730 RepID=A0A3P3DFY4_9RHOB|nr:ABC transporter ATP-binding protein [Falsigemmobacter faecalis]RRH73190.1 ABC transporter ATP-binding protein [Falsigemmobacter faecalis]
MTASLTPLLTVEGLNIALPPGADRPLAVEGAEFTLYPGRTLCIVGESGSGKSTIADAVIGLLPRPHLRPAAGRILFEGRDLLTLPETAMRRLRGAEIGMVFQEPMAALNPLMKIGAQLEEVLEIHLDLPASERRTRALAALNDVGLPRVEEICDSYPSRLSGGQRQRVVIACAMMLEPKLLICDEPTTALDVTTQAQILALIADLQKRRGTGVLFITHDFGVVSEIADDVIVMRQGLIEEAGPAAQVLRNPASAYTRQLIDAIPTGTAQQRPDPGGAPLLEIEGLRRVYSLPGKLFRAPRQVEALKGISLSLAAGQTIGIVGESGSGKSTLGRLVVGLEKPDGGSLRVKGRPLVAHRFDGRVQMIFQDPFASLNPKISIGETIAIGPITKGVPRAQAWARTEELLELVGLRAEAARRYPHEFSGGQRQRVGIARALAMDPELIVADEPVSALDVSVQAQVLDLFESLQKRLNFAMLFITHDLRVAARMCDQLAVMQRGEIVETGPSHEVLRAPRHTYTRTLLAAIPQLFSQTEREFN